MFVSRTGTRGERGLCGVNLGVCANRSEKNVPKDAVPRRMSTLFQTGVGRRGTWTGRGDVKLPLRPTVRRDPPDDGVEVGVTEDASSKGTKRKRAPRTKGPCEHGVKQRSNCKVCSACPHGKRRYQCKECGGSQICEHGRQRSKCKECGGAGICEHGRERCRCKECGGSQVCQHGRVQVRSFCKECGGSQICEHGRERRYCKECGGGSICEHGRRRRTCKECGGG